VEFKGWSLSVWASLFLMYALVSVGTKIVSGFLVDRYGAIRMVPWLSIPMGVGLVLLAVTSEIIWGGVFLALMGITVGLQSTVSAPFWAEMYGNKHLGAIKSLATSVMVLSTAISPIIIGWYIDQGISIETLAMVSAIVVFLTSALAWYACTTRQLSIVTLNNTSKIKFISYPVFGSKQLLLLPRHSYNVQHSHCPNNG